MKFRNYLFITLFSFSKGRGIMEINAKSKIEEVLKEYPFLIDYD
jgi:hypothetical protein